MTLRTLNAGDDTKDDRDDTQLLIQITSLSTVLLLWARARARARYSTVNNSTLIDNDVI